MSLRKGRNGKSSPASSSRPSNQSWEDDEYAQIIEGLKRIYNHKIRPLETTYNFEGTRLVHIARPHTINTERPQQVSIRHH